MSVQASAGSAFPEGASSSSATVSQASGDSASVGVTQLVARKKRKTDEGVAGASDPKKTKVEASPSASGDATAETVESSRSS